MDDTPQKRSKPAKRAGSSGPSKTIAPTHAMRRFVDYFGELGPRWGLQAATCRVHALLYLHDGPVTPETVERDLQMTADEVAAALSDLAEWGVAERSADGWIVGDDPWQLLITALEQRRKREMPDAIASMKQCVVEAEKGGDTPRPALIKMEGMLSLMRDLEAIHPSTQLLSSGAVRQVIGIGANVMRMFRGT